MKETFGIIISAFILIPTISIVSVGAAEDDTNMSVYIETSGDVNASFNATAGGNVTYWIDGIEVRGEFENIWDAIAYYRRELSDTIETANYAYFIATSNSIRLQKDEEKLEEHNQTLLIHYALINDTIANLLILRDEVIGFENEYFNYVNKTDATLETYKENLEVHEEEIASLKRKVAELTSTIIFIEIILILSLVSAIILYLINRRYPLKQLFRIRGNSYRQYKLVDFLGEADYNRSVLGTISRIRIRRKTEESPSKMLFHFSSIIKGGKNQ